MKFWKALVLALALFAGVAAAQDALVERVIEVQTSEKNPTAARAQLMNSAAEKVSETLIKEIIGEAKYSKNRALIQGKILKKSASFLPFSKAGELASTEEGHRMSVTVRANLGILQGLLLENGLFYDTESTPSVLPVVKWNDRVHSKTYGWWMGPADPAKAFLSKESRQLENALQEAFLKSGFYIIRPQGLQYADLLGPETRIESPSLDQVGQWAQAWNAQIAVQGHVNLSKSGTRAEAVEVDIRLAAVQILNDRVVAEVARKFETEPGAFEAVTGRKLKEMTQALATDLSAQLLEAWKQGEINSQHYRLRVLGRMSLPAQERFKESLRGRVHEIKSVRERVIGPDEIVYEIASSIGPREIAKKAQDLSVMGARFELGQASENELVYKIKK